MSKVIRKTNYRCRDDCRQEWCPSHNLHLEFDSITNTYTFESSERTTYDEEELKAMIDLIKNLDRKDCIQIK